MGWSSMLQWPWWMQGAAMRDPSSPRSSPSQSALAKRGWGTLLWRKKKPNGCHGKKNTKRIKKMKMIRMIFLVKHYIQKWSNIAKNLPAKGPPHRGHWNPCNDISLSSPALGPSLQKDHWASSLQNDKMMLTTCSTQKKKTTSYFRSTQG